MTPLTSALPARHGFFTREGGVSQGPYTSLNCSLSGGDDLEPVTENRARITRYLGATKLLGLTQIHSATIVTVTDPWAPDTGPRADGLVTDRPGLALGVITADCAPVLLYSAGVIGAVHAGWRGAVAGILEHAVTAMQALGARHITAAIGPCIRQPSYEVGADLRDAVLAGGAYARFFLRGRPGHWHFDLAGYCAARLLGHDVHTVAADTCADPRFWSHRRRTLAGGGLIGHQLSAIVL